MNGLLERLREVLHNKVETLDGKRAISNHSMCDSVLMNSSHLSFSASIRVPGLVQLSPQEWAAVSEPPVLAEQHSKFYQAGHGNSASQEISLRNFPEYVAFHYVANCMRSSHNHHLMINRQEVPSTNRQDARWVAVDNDRCFVPEAVAQARHVPSTHRK